MESLRFSTLVSAGFFLCLIGALSWVSVVAEQEVENLSGLSPNPDKDIFVVRENGTTCLMAEFAVKFVIPYDVIALNGIDLITEQASLSLPRGAQIAGTCGSSEAELHVSWSNNAYTFRLYFSKEKRTVRRDGKTKESEVWKISKVQLVYDTSETTHFINAYNPYKCLTDQRERLEETLPLVLGLILGFIIVITITIYHFHLKMTAQQPQLPCDRSLYKHM
ncbi:lysosome-associated membrane glycoprotein 5 precursor [Silurus meridionalis]|nr:lysosome-associated membrane glycoprotein 5 precursor [Silurus meridionalis]